MSRLAILLTLSFFLLPTPIFAIHTPESSCTTNSECTCGIDPQTQECTYGNRRYIGGICNTPDFCTGISGDCGPACISGHCTLSCSTRITATPTTQCRRPPQCPAPREGCRYINRTCTSCGQLVCTTTPTPTCSPRPPCLDSQPACLPPEPIGGWCPITITRAPSPPPTPTLPPNCQPQSDTLTVDPATSCSDIQEAIDSTMRTTVRKIHIMPGYYDLTRNGLVIADRENLQIFASQSPPTQSNTTIDTTGSPSGISILNSRNIEISGLEIKGNPTDEIQNDIINITNSQSTLLTQNHIHSSGRRARGIYTSHSPNTLVKSNLIEDTNGAISLRNGSDLSRVENNYINRGDDNAISLDSGGIQIRNNIIARHLGSGISIVGPNSQPITVINNTLLENGRRPNAVNTAGIDWQQNANILVQNNLLVDNEPYGLRSRYGPNNHTIGFNLVSSSRENYIGLPDQTDIQGGLTNLAPHLSPDYNLEPNSPAIDSGNPRLQYMDPDNSRNDIGAFGGPLAADWTIINYTPPPSPLTADVDHNLVVDLLDYNLLIKNYAKTGYPRGDLNADGGVNLLDYNLLLRNYGNRR